MPIEETPKRAPANGAAAVSDTEDGVLIKDTLAGKSEAFAELMTKYRPRLLELAFRILRNREDAEDVIQRVFIETYRHLADFRHDSKFSTWIYSIALNRTRNHLRGRKSHRYTSLDATWPDQETRTPMQLPDPTPSMERALEDRYDLRAIHDVIPGLPEDHQTIFVLHYFENLPLHDIAKRLDRPFGTVKVYLHRARKRVYELLQRKQAAAAAARKGF